MKLRMRGDSIRLRVTRGELATLARDGAVEEGVRFPGGATLTYRLAVGRDAAAYGASFDGGVVTVTLPEADARRWASGAEVGLRAEVPLPAGGALTLLVEKDFPCLTTRPSEDDSDAFPWPVPPPRC